jgi:hypothetical protein
MICLITGGEGARQKQLWATKGVDANRTARLPGYSKTMGQEFREDSTTSKRT